MSGGASASPLADNSLRLAIRTIVFWPSKRLRYFATRKLRRSISFVDPGDAGAFTSFGSGVWPQTAMLPETQFLSPKQFAAASGLSIATVRRYLDSGDIQSRQPAGKRHRILIPRSEINRVHSETAATASVIPSQSSPLPRPSRPKAGPQPRWRRRFEHQKERKRA
jgi:hypothetical protein